ncbi:hypothetical protein ACFFUW_11855 [Kurthia sibirica]
MFKNKVSAVRFHPTHTKEDVHLMQIFFFYNCTEGARAVEEETF